MTESDDNTNDTGRGFPASAQKRGVRAAMVEREWLWRMSGLGLSAVIALVIASLTLSPASGPSISIAGLDKVYHFVAFAALIFPLILTDSRRWAWAVPLAVGYGGLVELIQPTVGRSAEWLDFGADLAGVLAGAALAELLHDRIRESVFGAVDAAQESAAADVDHQRMEDIRAELMSELRVVLREELASVRRPGGEDPVGPSPAEEAAPSAAPSVTPKATDTQDDDPPRLRH